MKQKIGQLSLCYLILPAFVGGLTGTIVGFISWLVEDEFLTLLSSQHTLWMALLPILIFPLTYLAVKYTIGLGKEPTAEVYIEAYHDPQKRLQLREIPGRMLAAIATVGCGASQGLESPSNLIGAGIGNKLESLTKTIFKTDKLRGLLMTAGSSAGIAAIFSSPFVGVFYGLEVPFRNGINLRFFIPALVAGLSSYGADFLVRGERALIPFVPNAWNGWLDVIAALFVALCCGLGARLFCYLSERGREMAKHQSFLRRGTIAASGTVICAAISFIMLGQWVTFGPGHIATAWAFAEQHPAYLILLTLLLHTGCTLLCSYGGASGGVFTSLALAGALTGMFIGTLLGLPFGGMLPLIGAGCFLGAGYRIPLAGLGLILFRSFDIATIIIAIIAITIAYLAVGKQTVATASK